VIPHPEKKDKGGEDAYYVSDRVIAVADGVGGWSL
jgi:protein phosphatase PTC7